MFNKRVVKSDSRHGKKMSKASAGTKLALFLMPGWFREDSRAQQSVNGSYGSCAVFSQTDPLRM